MDEVNGTDAELLAAIRGGDRRAAEIFARRHAQWAVDYATREGGGDNSEDVAQTVLGNLTLRPPLALRSSSARSYMRVCIIRALARAKPSLSTVAPASNILDPRTSPSAAALRGELLEIADELVAELPSSLRLLVDLRYRDGLRPIEIAELTGRPAGSVTKLLSRAMIRIRQRLFLREGVAERSDDASTRE